jgi:carboxylesterase type B
VDTFLGIPYAAPPVGALRFAPPEAAQPWAPSRLDASKFSPDCFQIPDPTLNPVVDIHRMSEDCLYLNIFTPAGHAERSRHGFLTSSGTKLLPVMVWLHGGGFQQGGARRAEYDGRRLAGRDIIVVSLNYRLGALGFLVSTSDGIFGNFGLMDQRAAIEWIKRNIKAFGGDDDNITLFGESAGAVMIGMHLLMEGAGSLFHKAIMQSNPLGYTFRSVVIGDFIGEALKRAIDCRDLACLRTEKVEEILRAQRSLMGVPRSVGDFFTWSPSLTTEMKLKISVSNEDRFFSKAEEHRLPRIELDQRTSIVSEWRLGGDERTSDSARWSAVNVSQPLQTLGKIPDHIPIMIGTNKHEGEMFVHSAFPAPMPKAVYWMFVGALFRDSASRILRHYRGLVYEVEKQAEDLARKQMEEEENRQFYIENRVQLEAEYEMLLAMNHSRKKEKVEIMSREGLRALVNTWSGLGFSGGGSYKVDNTTSTISSAADKVSKLVLPGISAWSERWKNWTESREEMRLQQMKDKALRDAAKVVVDFRPVMSAIINDYLFRCPRYVFTQST